MKFYKFWPVALFLVPFIPNVTAAPPNDFFVTEATFPGITWNDIHGTTATNLFAVGTGPATTSTIATRAGGTWALQTVPNIGVLFRVWVFSSTVAYATTNTNVVASTSSVLKWNGATWATITAPLAVSAVWGRSATDVMFFGTMPGGTGQINTAIVPYNGATFGTVRTCATTAAQNAVAAARWIFTDSTQNGFAVGSTLSPGNTGQQITASPYASCTGLVTNTGQTNDYFSFTGSEDDGWSVGTGGVIYDQSIAAPFATPVLSPTQNNLRGIYGISNTNIWAVGDVGTVIHYDGVSWTTQPTTTAANYGGVWFFDATNGWAVASDGTLQKLQVNVAVGPPVVGLTLVHNEDAMDLTTQNTNCIGDAVPFTIDLDLSGVIVINDADIWIYSPAAGFWIQDIDDSAWTPVINALPASQFGAASTILPPGHYYALLIADLGGVGAVDLFDSKSFTVSKSPCTDSGAQDLTTITNRLVRIENQINNVTSNVVSARVDLNETHQDVDATEFNLVQARTDINNTRAQQSYQNSFLNSSFARTWLQQSYTNSLINNTRSQQSYQNTLANNTHAHIDAHFVYTNSLINATTGADFTLLMTFLNQKFNYTNALINQTIMFGSNGTIETMSISGSIDNGVYAWGVFFILIALIVWAELTRETLIYVLAMLAGIIVIFALPSGFLAYRLIVTMTVTLLGARAYMDMKSEDA